MTYVVTKLVKTFKSFNCVGEIVRASELNLKVVKIIKFLKSSVLLIRLPCPQLSSSGTFVILNIDIIGHIRDLGCSAHWGKYFSKYLLCINQPTINRIILPLNIYDITQS